MATAPALRGTLDDLPLPDVLALLARTNATGQLRVGGPHGGSLWLGDGEVYAASTEGGPSMWDSFVRTGTVSGAGWDAATAALSEGGGSLADALVRWGGADPSAVARVLHERVVTSVFELMLEPSAPFEFLPDERHPAGRYLGFAVEHVLDAVHQRLATWKEIAASIPSTAVVARMRPELPGGVADVTVTAPEWHVLAALDGRRSVAEVVRSLGMSAFDVCAVLHRLIVAGAVDVVDRDTGPAGGAGGRPPGR
jgi:Domain of unknown function (DUF4388)